MILSDEYSDRCSNSGKKHQPRPEENFEDKIPRSVVVSTGLHCGQETMREIQIQVRGQCQCGCDDNFSFLPSSRMSLREKLQSECHKPEAVCMFPPFGLFTRSPVMARLEAGNHCESFVRFLIVTIRDFKSGLGRNSNVLLPLAPCYL